MLDLGQKYGFWQMDSTGGAQILLSVPRKKYFGAVMSQHCSLHTLSEAVQMPRCKKPSSKRKTTRHHQL